jgi:hypothetical protein
MNHGRDCTTAQTTTERIIGDEEAAGLFHLILFVFDIRSTICL